MTYAADSAIDFNAVARELLSAQPLRSVATPVAGRSNGTELVPTEVNARIRREGQTFGRSLGLGATVDREGLSNNYAVDPQPYLALYPSPDQQRVYWLQGAAALVLVTLTLLTAVAVS